MSEDHYIYYEGQIFCNEFVTEIQFLREKQAILNGERNHMKDVIKSLIEGEYEVFYHINHVLPSSVPLEVNYTLPPSGRNVGLVFLMYDIP